MAKITKLVDDIDGSDATDTLEFSWGGDHYTIDLNDENATGFRNFMATYVMHATKVRHEVKAPAKRSGPSRTSSELAEIRDWARKQGHQVSEFGRIREEIVTAWENRPQEPETDAEEAKVIARITPPRGDVG